jgi:hypothetical protein
MLKKLAALGLTAALAFAPLHAMAQTPSPDAAAATPDAGATPEAKPMKHKMHKSMKHKAMKHKAKKMEATPSSDATPDAPK